jgi:hypothetical protein
VRRIEALEGLVTQDGTYDLSFAVLSDERVAESAEEICEINSVIKSELSGLR